MAGQPITFPCGVTTSSNHITKHLKKCAKCRRLYESIFSDENRSRLQKVINKTDLKLKEVAEELTKEFGFPVVGRSLISKVLERIIDLRVFPEDGDKKCICGFRTRNIGIIMNHKRVCKENQEALDKALKNLKDLDNLNKYLVEDGLTVREYIEELEPEVYKYNPDLYNIMLDYVKTLISEGKLDYEIKHITDLLKDERLKRKQESTVLKKYGVRNVSQSSKIKRKKEQTSLKKFGVKYHTQLESQKQKIKEIVRSKYGVDNVSQIEDVKKKKAETFQKHYGVDNIFRLKDYIKQKFREKYGVDNPVYDPDINLKRLKNYVDDGMGLGRSIMILGKKFTVMSEHEETFLRLFVDKDNKNKIQVNNTILELRTQNNQEIYVPDVMYKDYVVELKGLLQNDEYIKKCLRVCKTNGKKILVYSDKPHLLAVVKNGKTTIFPFENLKSLETIKNIFGNDVEIINNLYLDYNVKQAVDLVKNIMFNWGL